MYNDNNKIEILKNNFYEIIIELILNINYIKFNLIFLLLLFE